MARSSTRKRKLMMTALIAMGVAVLAAWAGIILQGAEPWIWVALAIQSASLIIGVICLVRFVLSQRDDYWRDRGRDPRDPAKPADG